MASPCCCPSDGNTGHTLHDHFEVAPAAAPETVDTIMARIAAIRDEWKTYDLKSFEAFCRIFDNDTPPAPAALADWKTTLIITDAVWRNVKTGDSGWL